MNQSLEVFSTENPSNPENRQSKVRDDFSLLEESSGPCRTSGLKVEKHSSITGSYSCIQEAFEKQAALTPDVVAAVHQGCRLTYRELNTRVNQLAAHLRQL